MVNIYSIFLKNILEYLNIFENILKYLNILQKKIFLIQVMKRCVIFMLVMMFLLLLLLCFVQGCQVIILVPSILQKKCGQGCQKYVHCSKLLLIISAAINIFSWYIKNMGNFQKKKKKNWFIEIIIREVAIFYGHVVIFKFSLLLN